MDIKGQTYLYVDGEEYKVSKTLAKNLTQKAQVTIMATVPEDQATVQQLLVKGFYFYFDGIA